MGKLVAGAVLLFIAFSLLLTAATVRSQRPGPVSNLVRLAGYVVGALALLIVVASLMVVIAAGEVGVRHAFGTVDPVPRSEEHTSELQSHLNLVCRLLLEKKNNAP